MAPAGIRHTRIARLGRLGLLVGLWLVACAARAEDAAVAYAPPASDRAGEFLVGGHLDLATLEGTTFSYKQLTSPAGGWRLSVSPSFHYENERYTLDDYLYGEDQRRNHKLEICWQRLHFRTIDRSTRLMWGFGAVVELSYQDSKTLDYDSATSSRRISRTLSYGTRGTVGVEFRFLDEMSLLAEYAFVVMQLRVNTDITRTDGSAWHEDRMYLYAYTEGVRLGLSVYF